MACARIRPRSCLRDTLTGRRPVSPYNETNQAKEHDHRPTDDGKRRGQSAVAFIALFICPVWLGEQVHRVEETSQCMKDDRPVDLFIDLFTALGTRSIYCIGN
jgi:hypothetical protein